MSECDVKPPEEPERCDACGSTEVEIWDDGMVIWWRCWDCDAAGRWDG